ncbi:hypothetical protein RJ639_003507 [Escallonia herrerae]|uniref:SKP1 component POZ domain-containing protein n=1 Tax=Escallonia herrerae TaxID=1293975 RepID=A0AA88W3E9_9ASTE|nr:hypothetical protein RJ639_003507 [Escallonia herrerae]
MRKEDTVKLISAEGFEFVVDKKAAMVSQTIRNMLTSPGTLDDDPVAQALRIRLSSLSAFYTAARRYRG